METHYIIYFLASSNPAKCNAETGEWVKPKGYCYSTWKPNPECEIPSSTYGGYWYCATMLTDPNERESAKLPDNMERVVDKGGQRMTTAELVSENSEMTERWYQQPTLGLV